nr:hypothetical protein CFP56_52281 [Quercus suber]
MALDIDFTRRNKKPRLLTEPERDMLDEFVDSIHYSSRYVQRRPLRIPPRRVAEADAQEDPQGLLRRLARHAQAAVGGGVAGAGHHAEPRVGALRGARAGAAYSAVQASDQLPTSRPALSQWPLFDSVHTCEDDQHVKLKEKKEKKGNSEKHSQIASCPGSGKRRYSASGSGKQRAREKESSSPQKNHDGGQDPAADPTAISPPRMSLSSFVVAVILALFPIRP